MEELFDVIFLDEDRTTILDMQKVKKGDKAEYKGNPPVKEPTAQVKYTFEGWIGAEELENIQDKTIVFARYVSETINASKDENDMYNENANLKNTIESGQKVSAQQLAVEKDSRTTEEIVNDIVENGKTEVGQEIDKDMEK